MLNVEDYHPCSFSVGAGHARAFSLRNAGGVVADYVLGECSAEKTPFSTKQYTQVRQTIDSVELSHPTSRKSLTVTIDNVVLADVSASREKTPRVKEALDQAVHVFPGIYQYINEPKVKHIGLVWGFYLEGVADDTTQSCKVAPDLAGKLLAFKPGGRATPLDLALNISLRVDRHPKLQSEDRFQYNLQFSRVFADSLWHTGREVDPEAEDRELLSFLQIDVQWHFKPFRNFKDYLISKFYSDVTEVLQPDILAILQQLHAAKQRSV